MAAMSDFLENTLLDWLFRGQAATAINGASAAAGSGPATTYAALLTAAPTDAGGGTEVSGGSYARVAISSTLGNWMDTGSVGSGIHSAGNTGTISNKNAITFPAPTANWGTVTHFALYDASTTGHLLLWGSLTTAKTVNNGDAAPSFAAGALTFQIDN